MKYTLIHLTVAIIFVLAASPAGAQKTETPANPAYDAALAKRLGADEGRKGCKGKGRGYYVDPPDARP